MEFLFLRKYTRITHSFLKCMQQHENESRITNLKPDEPQLFPVGTLSISVISNSQCEF